MTIFISRTEGAMAKEAVGSVDLDAVVNLDDMERAAERVMDRQDFDYFAGGASPAPSRHPSDRSTDCSDTPRCLPSLTDDDPPMRISLPSTQAPRPSPHYEGTAPRSAASPSGRDAWSTSPT